MLHCKFIRYIRLNLSSASMSLPTVNRPASWAYFNGSIAATTAPKRRRIGNDGGTCRARARRPSSHLVDGTAVDGECSKPEAVPHWMGFKLGFFGYESGCVTNLTAYLP